MTPKCFLPEGRFMRGDQELGFGHVELELSIRNADIPS